MGQVTVNTIFKTSGIVINKIASAFFTQEVKRAITEKAIKITAIRYLMTGEILAIMIAEKPVTILHTSRPLNNKDYSRIVQGYN